MHVKFITYFTSSFLFADSSLNLRMKNDKISTTISFWLKIAQLEVLMWGWMHEVGKGEACRLSVKVNRIVMC